MFSQMTQQRLKEIVFWGLVFFVLFFFIKKLAIVLLPFVVGGVFAFFLDPLVDKLQKRNLSRLSAVSIVFFGFLFVFCAFLLWLLPFIVRQFADFISSGAIKSLVDVGTGFLLKGVAFVETYVNNHSWLQSLFLEEGHQRVDLSALLQQKSDEIGTTLSSWVTSLNLGGRFAKGGAAVVQLLSFLFITPLVGFFLLKDWDKIMQKISDFIPREHVPFVGDVITKISYTMRQYVRGQSLVCLILAFFYSISLTLAGLKYGFIVGLLAGALTFIPYVGMMIGALLSIGLAFAFWQGWGHLITVALIFVAGQVMEGNFLTPRLVGRSVGLHELWVIAALLVFGSLFGFVGVLLAIPSAAVLAVLFSSFYPQYLRSSIYQGVKGKNVSNLEEDL